MSAYIMSANNINTSKKLIRNKKIKLDEKQAKNMLYVFVVERNIATFCYEYNDLTLII